MSPVKQLSLPEMMEFLPRKPGLLLGPDATAPFGALGHAIRTAIEAISFPKDLANIPVEDYSALIDALRAADSALAASLETKIKDSIRQLPHSRDLEHLSRAGWSACISLAQDLVFEGELRTYYDGLPSSRSVTIVDHPSIQPPQRTVPVYKLLGSLDNQDRDHSLALAASDIAMREQNWPFLLRTLADHVKDAPILCVGAESVINVLKKALATLLSMAAPNVSAFMFLRGDTALRDPTIKVMLRRTNVYVVDASLREICDATANLKPRQRGLILKFNGGESLDRLVKVLDGFAAIVSLVPTKLPADFDMTTHQHALVDALFRPTAIDWAPYLCDLDLRRQAGSTLYKCLVDILDEPRTDNFRSVAVIGEAGVGKTTAVKRVACDLAAAGNLVLWARRAPGNWMRQWRQLANELAELLRTPHYRDKRFVIVCDDAWALRLDASELMSCFERFRGRIAFVFVTRYSDYVAPDRASIASLPLTTEQVEVSYQLSADEIDGLGEMLVKIGAAPDIKAAAAIVAGNPSPNSKDILCSLWYLVPETQGQLAQSLEDQYRRLDTAAESISSFAQQAALAGHVAKKAYECVTVASNLDIGVPMEVLVRALQVNYSDWHDMSQAGRPIWGLLYDDYNDEESTVVYRTRNEVVTKVLLSLVNGGIGHAGEVRVLRELLAACDGGAPIYRQFVLDLLARGRNKLAKVVTYEQGLELFDVAEAALPYRDRILGHHKGIWMAQVGREFKAAYTQFEKALDTEVYPGSDGGAPAEHIHTSMAAAVVQLVKINGQSRESGLELVRNHLRIANAASYFQAHTSHVAANLLFEMAKKDGALQYDEIAFGAMGEALEEIERAIQMIGAKGRNQFRFAKSTQMLDDLRTEILTSIPDIEVMKNTARELFSRSGSQSGFEAVARCMLSSATHVDKGRAFNAVQNYISETQMLISNTRKQMSVELRSVRADLIIRWRVQRPSGQIDWKMLREDLESVLAGPKYRESILKKFYLGVALYHLKEVTNANVVFSGVRRASSNQTRPNDVRCFLLGKEGSPRRVQCLLEKSQGRFYATVSELGTDVPITSPPSDVGPGATTHCYIGFSLNGATAVFNKPDDTELMLA